VFEFEVDERIFFSIFEGVWGKTIRYTFFRRKKVVNEIGITDVKAKDNIGSIGSRRDT